MTIDRDEQTSLVAELVDRQRIEDTLYRYASAIDSKDFDAVRRTLAPDVVGIYGASEPIRGADALMEWLLAATADRGWQHHLLNVYHVDVDGDTARALTYHTSHQTTVGDPDSLILIVARYRDTLRRTGRNWVITEKIMDIGWRERREHARTGSTH